MVEHRHIRSRGSHVQIVAPRISFCGECGVMVSIPDCESGGQGSSPAFSPFLWADSVRGIVAQELALRGCSLVSRAEDGLPIPFGPPFVFVRG